jgi:signal peptidase I
VIEPAPAAARIEPVEKIPQREPISRRRWTGRGVVELFVTLLVGLALSRTFLLEAYVVPSGSMAPVLLGLHAQLVCEACGFDYALGLDEPVVDRRPVCLMCGLEAAPGEIGAGEGDRLLVNKSLFELRGPVRYEVVVFEHPIERGEAYVKRIVGLPGETVEIRAGDVWIDGKIGRKSAAQSRVVRQLVFDQDYARAAWSARSPRWVMRRGATEERLSSGWRPEGSGFQWRSVEAQTGESEVDWLEYRHWRPDGSGYGPVLDFAAYNGAVVAGEERVDDLGIDAELVLDHSVSRLHVRFAAHRAQVSIPVGDRDREDIVLFRGEEVLARRKPNRGLPVGRAFRFEAAWVDAQVMIWVDGRLLFEPIIVNLAQEEAPTGWDRPMGIGLEGQVRSVARVSHLRIFRDIHYTGRSAHGPVKARGVGEPVRLGPDEYFVLGDNSPISNDSRFWPEGAAVRSKLLLGKPFLVHVPGWSMPAPWPAGVPDPRKIRYIE